MGDQNIAEICMAMLYGVRVQVLIFVRLVLSLMSKNRIQYTPHTRYQVWIDQIIGHLICSDKTENVAHGARDETRWGRSVSEGPYHDRQKQRRVAPWTRGIRFA